ncbi:hypothetical protein YC2023_116129 [Brassica napus]
MANARLFPPWMPQMNPSRGFRSGRQKNWRLFHKNTCLLRKLTRSPNVRSSGTVLVNMISFALLNCSVKFEVSDCTSKHYPDISFEVIYSRNTIMHIQGNPALFRTFFNLLKPGGKVLISDSSRSPKALCPKFSEYINRENMTSMMFKHMFCKRITRTLLEDGSEAGRSASSEDTWGIFRKKFMSTSSD